MEIHKNIKPSIFHAVQALVGGDLVTSNRESFEATEYRSEQTPPSKEDAEKKLEEMTILWNRVNSYPSTADQLDLLYHQGIEGWKAEIKKVKDQFPKP